MRRQRWLGVLLVLGALIGACDDDGESPDGDAGRDGGGSLDVRSEAATVDAPGTEVDTADGGVQLGDADAGDRGDVNAGVLVVSSQPREILSAPLPEVQQLTADNRSFGTRLYRALRTEAPAANLFFSPHSISVALAMTHGGARGTTATQMATTLSYQLPGPTLHRAFNALDQELARRSQGIAGEGDPPLLTATNALWGKRGGVFLPAYLDLLRVNYGAGLHLLDFVGDLEGARLTINRWVEEQTAGRILDLLMPGVLMPDTALVLTNAIYFKASWQQPFIVSATVPRAFQAAPGNSFDVPTMERTGRMKYAETADVRAVELPYKGGQLAMLMVATKPDRAAAFQAALSAPALDAVTAGLAEREVRLRLPKFKLTARFKLKPTLSALGMAEAFGGQADFSGMNGTGGLAISDVIHQAFVALDEKGTEAAAATAVVVGPPSIPVAEVELDLDHPFLFLIRDLPTGAVLFMGWLADPR
jgi:serpin B